MTVEERLKLILGEQQFQIVWLSVKLEEANKKIAELEAAATQKSDHLKTVKG